MTGSGWAIYKSEQLVCCGCESYVEYVEVYDSEALALRDGLSAMITRAEPGGRLWACLDNQAAIKAVLNLTTKSISSQKVIEEIRELLREWDSLCGRESNDALPEAAL